MWKEGKPVSGFVNALSASLVLMALMAVGFFMGWRGWMGPSEKKFLSKYIVNIAVPCTCITGLLSNLSHDMLLEAGFMLLSAVVGILLTLLLSMGLAQLLHIPHNRWGVFVAMTGLSNVLFIGLPVCTQLFGDACLPYVMIYYLGNTSFLQSVAIMLIQRSGTAQGTRTTVAGFFKSLLSKPPILGVIFSIVMLVLDLQLPSVVMKFAGYIGDTVSPLALIYCGYVIWEVGLKNLRLLPGLPTMLVVRLGVAPLICWAICHLFGVTGLAMQVFVVESALPVVSQVPVLSGAFGADEQYAATGACLSTLASFVTIPVLMLLIG